ncbi:MAG: methylated-DNA--[Ruminococcus sp.]|nr:methylated-DNA--[protein]-cysteine S-methyltransferase [Ruminococcus sp.]
MTYKYSYSSPLGGITIASDGNALIGLWFDGQKYFGDTLKSEAIECDLPIFRLAVKWLDVYFSGTEPDYVPPIRLSTTPFREAVSNIMRSIPYGYTMTYGEIADIIAKQRGIKRMSAQAVGGAVSHNPISIIIPCHRVIGSDGGITGYAGGIDKKIRLLELEKAL